MPSSDPFPSRDESLVRSLTARGIEVRTARPPGAGSADGDGDGTGTGTGTGSGFDACDPCPNAKPWPEGEGGPLCPDGYTAVYLNTVRPDECCGSGSGSGTGASGSGGNDCPFECKRSDLIGDACNPPDGSGTGGGGTVETECGEVPRTWDWVVDSDDCSGLDGATGSVEHDDDNDQWLVDESNGLDCSSALTAASSLLIRCLSGTWDAAPTIPSSSTPSASLVSFSADPFELIVDVEWTPDADADCCPGEPGTITSRFTFTESG